MSTCYTCELPIKGKTITAGGVTYHPDHFCCGWCKAPLVIEAYYTIDGVNVCQTCRNSEKCYQCGFMITETKYVKVDDKVWHEECFVCDECFIELKKFHFEDGRLLCSECLLDVRAAADPDKCCAKCKKALTGSIIKALGKKWHDECFSCCRCNGPFPNDEFVKIQGMPYCDPCADIVEAESLKKLPDDLKNIHVSGGGRGGAGGRGRGRGRGRGGRGGGPGRGAGVGGAGAGAGAGGVGRAGAGSAGVGGASAAGVGGASAGGAGGASAAGVGGASAGGAGAGAGAGVGGAGAGVGGAGAARGDHDDEYSEKYKYLDTSNLPPKEESKYAQKKPNKLVSTTQASRDRDFKSKAALMVGADASHLNELDNNEFSSKR